MAVRAGELANEPAEEADPSATPAPATEATEQPEAEEAMDDEASADSSAEDSSDEETSDEMMAEEAEPDYCLDCHTDQDRLTAVAAEEEAVEDENEGEG